MYEIDEISQTSVERSGIMSKNVGRMDAYVRTALGLTLISLGIIQKRGWMAALGSLKVATGVTRYCPILEALQLSTVCEDELLEECGCDVDYQDSCSDEYATFDEYYLAHHDPREYDSREYTPKTHYHKKNMQ